jgi:hypothetical protein
VWHVYNPMERDPVKRGHLVVHNKVQQSYHAKENVIPTAGMMQPVLDAGSCTWQLHPQTTALAAASLACAYN